MRRRWFLMLSLIAAIAMFSVGVVLWQAIGLSSLSNVSDQVLAAKPVLSVLRFTLIGLLALSWPRLPALWVRANDNDGRAHAHWMALRWRVAGWLLVIELVLGHNIFGRFLAAIAEYMA